ncbi:acyl carrier protein [Streptomyces sp. C11-1]|uniref:Acyl carrier protein n=1 Tax=Streptomyces durocortorensis TaxID=2811104 RepID=A0ABY9VVP5_9ACTN|nr:acyl carrier protein [Streptomyces durocortorensis]WNF28002.1 acyl carrier protein [Streptomyces durocortorensis]
MSETAVPLENAVDRDKAVEAIGSALREVLGREIPGLHEDLRLFDQVGLDSSGVFELLMGLEERLGIELDTDQLEMSHFESVRTLADFLLAETGA